MERPNGVLQAKVSGCILSCYLFNLYAGHVLLKIGLGSEEEGVKTDRRSISNLRYAYDTTLLKVAMI